MREGKKGSVFHTCFIASLTYPPLLPIFSCVSFLIYFYCPAAKIVVLVYWNMMCWFVFLTNFTLNCKGEELKWSLVSFSAEEKKKKQRKDSPKDCFSLLIATNFVCVSPFMANTSTISSVVTLLETKCPTERNNLKLSACYCSYRTLNLFCTV